jgi:hypothetical protein
MYIVSHTVSRVKHFFKENQVFLQSYFLALVIASGGMNYLSAPGLGFRGRPLPATLRMALRVSGGYIFSSTIGLIPATNRRCLTALGFIPSSFESSVMVNPVTFIPHYRILTIGEKSKKFVDFFKKLLTII